MKYQLVIFDCDGTLVDTLTDVSHCFSDALSACGFGSCSIEQVSPFIGKPLESIVQGLIETLGHEARLEDIQRVAVTYRSIYAEHKRPNTRPFPGMVELVDALLDAGTCVAVNSNKPQPALVDLIARCFPKRPMRVVGYEVGRPTKPDPAGALLLVQKAKVDVSQAVYIGDTVVDLETARAAGMRCVIMKWGSGTEELYDNSHLLACCDSADQLRCILMAD